ncbi:uncharacterized protein LAJ45_01210 [Morchella importuna]|uniref:uncharacterized protein n=1 Tax=Morchella importuna TaxID=1174673 RepID=UPI001E8DAE09|nr:uncharacterized protein LAJ45_01210 [Morchella importuna]KAH8154679.1 hypothetical protein LAJ45_01210 [Morchella importuna]
MATALSSSCASKHLILRFRLRCLCLCFRMSILTTCGFDYAISGIVITAAPATYSDSYLEHQGAGTPPLVTLLPSSTVMAPEARNENNIYLIVSRGVQ